MSCKLGRFWIDINGRVIRLPEGLKANSYIKHDGLYILVGHKKTYKYKHNENTSISDGEKIELQKNNSETLFVFNKEGELLWKFKPSLCHDTFKEIISLEINSQGLIQLLTKSEKNETRPYFIDPKNGKHIDCVGLQKTQNLKIQVH